MPGRLFCEGRRLEAGVDRMKIWGQNSRHDDGSVGEGREGEGMRGRRQGKWREGRKKRKGEGGTERGKEEKTEVERN